MHTIAWKMILVLLVTVPAAIYLGGPSRDFGTSEAHHAGTRFKNVHHTERPGFIDFLTWRWNRRSKDIPAADSYNFTLANSNVELLRSNRDKTTITWIGHATVLLQLNGLNILTDPHFTERASPVSWAGPKRVVQPGIALEDLPKIDVVVVSHDHYDSLDAGTIEELLQRKGGDNTMFFVPLGLKAWFKDVGATRVTEMDWWETRQQNGIEIIAVPVHHWSQRTPLSKNATLWAGWVIRSKDFSFFFAGDSGYTTHFKEIGEKLGPFDLAAIPIGAYEPRWFMKHYHINPEESVQVHLDVQAKRSVAIHWGTFMLTDEPLDEPPKRLAQALEAKGLTEDDFTVLKHGETVTLVPGEVGDRRDETNDREE